MWLAGLRSGLFLGRPFCEFGPAVSDIELGVLGGSLGVPGFWGVREGAHRSIVRELWALSVGDREVDSVVVDKRETDKLAHTRKTDPE